MCYRGVALGRKFWRISPSTCAHSPLSVSRNLSKKNIKKYECMKKRKKKERKKGEQRRSLNVATHDMAPCFERGRERVSCPWIGFASDQASSRIRLTHDKRVHCLRWCRPRPSTIGRCRLRQRWPSSLLHINA